jgi:hypothetical protein
MEQAGSHWMDFHEICYLSIFQKSVEKIQVSLNQTKIADILHEDQYTFLIISCSVTCRVKDFFSDKDCRENQNTHFVLNNFFFSKIVPFIN